LTKKSKKTGLVLGNLPMNCEARLSRFGWLKVEQVTVGVTCAGKQFVPAKVVSASSFVKSYLRFILD
jgi:hypothetical protein